MTEAPAIHPLRIASFRAYMFGRLCGMLAGSGMMIVIGWQAYNIARESMAPSAAAAQLGFIGLAQFLPLFLLTPVTGWAADHFDRRRIVQLTTSLLLLCAALLGMATYEGWISLKLIFAIAALLGIARAFNGPAMSALAPNLVPKSVLPNAIALSGVAMQVGLIVGPALAGYAYAAIPWGAYAGASALLTLSILALLTIGPVPQSARDVTRHPLRQMVDGLSYVRGNRLVLAAITLDLFAVLLAGTTALLPVFARDILHVGARGLGQMAAAPGVGATLTALWFSVRPIRKDVGIKMLGAVIVFGLATIAFGCTKFVGAGVQMPLALGAMAIWGSADMFSVYVRSSLIQLHTPDAMRGRVSSVSQLTISASNELGAAESGFLAALIGPVAAVVAGGVGAVIITLAWARLFPELRRARTFDPPDERAADITGDLT